MQAALPVAVLLWAASSIFELSAVEVRPAGMEWRAEPFVACHSDRCAFQDSAGTNLYEIAEGELARSSAGATVYRRSLTGKYERVLLAGLTAAGNQLAVVIAREKVSIRGLGVSGQGIHPKDVEREHRVEIVNPKSGETVKALDLGAFRPAGLALSAHGELILLHGKDLQLGSREVRLYNARSGKLEHQATIDASAGVTLAVDGYTVGGSRWVVAEGEARSQKVFNSRDPYSIAEYIVECSAVLTTSSLRGRTLAVLKFNGADFELGQMLSNNLALKLRGAGFSVAERQGMEELLEEIHLQQSGLTSESQAAAIGKLVNAQLLVFGALQKAGTNSSLTVRLVSVEEGKVVGGCELSCRDCRPDDYMEGLDRLISVWVGKS